MPRFVQVDDEDGQSDRSRISTSKACLPAYSPGLVGYSLMLKFNAQSLAQPDLIILSTDVDFKCSIINTRVRLEQLRQPFFLIPSILSFSHKHLDEGLTHPAAAGFWVVWAVKG